MQWRVLFKKEMLESWRNFKWVWVPLVFILLAIMEPISSYYLPMIIESVGGLPESTIIEMPDLLPSEVLMMTLAQLSSLGVLIIVLMSMGTIGGEIKSGVSELILVKPVSYRNYITSKWAALLLIIWLSLVVSMISSWYYVNLLFGDLLFLSLLQTILFYGLWLTLVATLSIFYNTLFKTPGLVAALTIITIIAMSVVTSIFEHLLIWSPINLSKHIGGVLLTNEVSTDLIFTAFVTVGMIGILLISSIHIFKTKELVQ